MSESIPFTEFPKLSRFSRECIITEKIDGTNAQIRIEQDGTFLTGSRTKWITPGDDNYGFSRWAHANKDELMKLGPGCHFGEWWGAGIQRTYGLREKRFSLFNVERWGNEAERPKCCGVVPTLWRGPFDAVTPHIEAIFMQFKESGSVASPGFMKPEGVVIYHVAGNVGFKKTIEKDETPKSLVKSS